MTTYNFRANRKSDGTEIHSYFIHDLEEEGAEATMANIRQALIKSHPLARGLSSGDIGVELSVLAPVEN